jgi:uncharacterized membrane protein SirB2
MSYQLLISLHVAMAIISLLLFIGRGIWVMQHDPQQRPRWMKWVPHANDTLLLVFGVWLAIMLQQNPLVQTWLSVKLAALLLYILLGMVVMKWASQRHWQLAAWLAALLVYSYMISVAVTKQPLWFLN